MELDLSNRRVKDEMSRAVIFAHPEDTLEEALSLMAEYRLTALPVTDAKNRCVGIISTTDLVEPYHDDESAADASRQGEGNGRYPADQLFRLPLAQRKVEELMTPNVVSVDRETTVLKAAGQMLRHRVHHLPVVDKQQQLLGIVSTMDLLSAFAKAVEDIA